jgi:hypothetical protein
MRVRAMLRRGPKPDASTPTCPRCGVEVRLGWTGPVAIAGVRSFRCHRELLEAHCPRHGQSPFNGI